MFDYVRIQLIGISLSFFLVMVFMDLCSNFFTALSIFNQRIWECFMKVQQKMTSTTRDIITLTDKEIAYRSQMIVSNL